LTKKYRDIPMDLADASLVLASAGRNIKEIITIDGDFFVYRTPAKEMINNVFVAATRTNVRTQRPSGLMVGCGTWPPLRCACTGARTSPSCATTKAPQIRSPPRQNHEVPMKSSEQGKARSARGQVVGRYRSQLRSVGQTVGQQFNVGGSASIHINSSEPVRFPQTRAESVQAIEREFGYDLRALERCYVTPDLQDFNPPDEMNSPAWGVKFSPLPCRYSRFLTLIIRWRRGASVVVVAWLAGVLPRSHAACPAHRNFRWRRRRLAASCCPQSKFTQAPVQIPEKINCSKQVVRPGFSTSYSPTISVAWSSRRLMQI